jgi:hypothetical protein
MLIDIRKLNTVMSAEHSPSSNTRQTYFAYTKSSIGKATYCLCFTDDIMGAVILNNFIQMLRDYFKPVKVDIKISDREVTFKNEYLLELLND